MNISVPVINSSNILPIQSNNNMTMPPPSTEEIRPYSNHTILQTTRYLPDVHRHYVMNDFVTALNTINDRNTTDSNSACHNWFNARLIKHHFNVDHYLNAAQLCSIIIVPTDIQTNLHNQIWSRSQIITLLPRYNALAPLYNVRDLTEKDIFGNSRCFLILEYRPTSNQNLANIIAPAFKYLINELKLIVNNIVCALPPFISRVVENKTYGYFLPMFSSMATHPIETALENTIRLLTMSIWLRIYTQPRIIWIPPTKYLGIITDSVFPSMNAQYLINTELTEIMEYRTMTAIARDFPLCTIAPQHEKNLHIFRQMLNKNKLPHLIPLYTDGLLPELTQDNSNNGIVVYIGHIIDILMKYIEDRGPEEKEYRSHLTSNQTHYPYLQQTQNGTNARHIIMGITRKLKHNFAINLYIGLQLSGVRNPVNWTTASVTWSTLVVCQEVNHLLLIVLPPLDTDTTVDIATIQTSTYTIPIPLVNAENEPITIEFEIFMMRPEVIIVNIRDRLNNVAIWSTILLNQSNLNHSLTENNLIHEMPLATYNYVYGDTLCGMYITPLLPHSVFTDILTSISDMDISILHSVLFAQELITDICSLDIATPFHVNSILAPHMETNLYSFTKCDEIPFRNGISPLFFDIKMPPPMIETGSLFGSSHRTTRQWCSRNDNIRDQLPKILASELTIEFNDLMELDYERFANFTINSSSLSSSILDKIHMALRLDTRNAFIPIMTNDLLSDARLYLPLSHPQTPVLTTLSNLMLDHTENIQAMRYTIGVGFIWTYFTQEQVQGIESSPSPIPSIGQLVSASNPVNDPLVYYALIAIDLSSFEKRLIYITKHMYPHRYVPLMIEFDDVNDRTVFYFDYSINMGLRESNYTTEDCVFSVPYNFLHKVLTSKSNYIPFHIKLYFGVCYPFDHCKDNALMMPFLWKPSNPALFIDISLDTNLTNTQWSPNKQDVLTRTTSARFPQIRIYGNTGNRLLSEKKLLSHAVSAYV